VERKELKGKGEMDEKIMLRRVPLQCINNNIAGGQGERGRERERRGPGVDLSATSVKKDKRNTASYVARGAGAVNHAGNAE
jgi:hypothetical protein